MRHYRLYYFSAPAGHIRNFSEFEAASDDEAVAKAEALADNKTAELWCEHRKVRRFEQIYPPLQSDFAKSAVTENHSPAPAE